MKIRHLFVLSLALHLVMGVAGNGYSYSLLGYKWTTNSATFYSKGTNNALYDDAFKAALGQWNNLSNFTFHVIDAYADPCSEVSPPINSWGIQPSYCGVAFGSSTLAITGTWYSAGTIIESDIVFNGTLPWNVYSGSYNGAFDFRRVAVHELGHTLGLGHDDSAVAIMNSYYSQTLETPQGDDINGIRAIYGGSGSDRASVEAFVTRFYQQSLGREPDLPGLNNWVNALIARTISGGDTAYGFIFSIEFTQRNTSNEDFLLVMYRAFFNREPDTPGWQGWLNYLQGAPTGDRTRRESVLNGFIYSIEFESLCSNYGINAH